LAGLTSAATARVQVAKQRVETAQKNRERVEAAERLKKTNLEILKQLEHFENRLTRLNVWTVRFTRTFSVSRGETLYVVGDCETLGDNNPQNAVAMSCLEGDMWSATVADVPEGTRYRYLLKKGHGEIKFLTEYYLELASVLEQCNVIDKMLVVDDSDIYLRFKVSRADAKKVFVTGSLDELGGWQKDKALELQRKSAQSNTWETVVKISAQLLADFEYKFFEIPAHGKDIKDIRFENGANRISDAHLVEPQREVMASGELGCTRISTLECVWEGLLIRFVIYHPLDNPDAVLACSGSHPAFGKWLADPRRMGLGNERTLLTGIKGRCWETTFAAGEEEFRNLQYRC